MITFWISAAVMILIALLLLLPVLLRKREVTTSDRDHQNIQIAREHLRELEVELAAQRITQDEYEQGRGEIEQALLDDVGQEEGAAGEVRIVTSRWSAAFLAVSIPVFAAGLYLVLGTPSVMGPPVSHTAQQQQAPAVAPEKLPPLAEMVPKLEQRLKKQPDDAEGWFMLGRAYMILKRYTDATDAFDMVYKQVGDHPDLLLFYADALAMAQQGTLTGKPAALIERSLEMQPDNPKGLWLAGMAKNQAGDHEAALRYWQRLEPMLDDDPATLAELRLLINRAEKELGRTPQIPSVAMPEIRPRDTMPGKRLTVQVSLDPAFKDRVAPDDTVFVFARAIDGPPMPLAVLRKRVADLPLEVILDDSMAMMPAMRLSGFAEVRVSARISRSGNALPQSGDLSGEVVPVTVGSSETVRVTISKLIP